MAIDGRTFRLQRTIASAIDGDRTALDGPELPLESPALDEEAWSPGVPGGWFAPGWATADGALWQ